MDIIQLFMLDINKIDYLCSPKRMWKDLAACNHTKKC